MVSTSPEAVLVMKRASTRASSAPSRITDTSARRPTTKLIASTNMVFPAPVSPVNAVNPLSKETRTFSMMPRFSIDSSTSIIDPTTQI